jgi:hypothetical protein
VKECCTSAKPGVIIECTSSLVATLSGRNEVMGEANSVWGSRIPSQPPTTVASQRTTTMLTSRRVPIFDSVLAKYSQSTPAARYQDVRSR